MNHETWGINGEDGWFFGDSLPSGKRLHSELENGLVEIVDLPIKNGDFL
jgi:hypothetical protein